VRFEYRRRLLLSRVLFKNLLVLEATEFSAGSSKEDASNMASVISDVRGRGGRIQSHHLARHIPSSLLLRTVLLSSLSRSVMLSTAESQAVGETG